MFKFSGCWSSKCYPNIMGTLSVILPAQVPTQNMSFNTEVTLVYSKDSMFRPDETIILKTTSIVGMNNDNIVCLVQSETTDIIQSFLFSLYRVDMFNWNGIYTCVHPADLGTLTLECETKCLGCIEDQPNQLAHMYPGGCLDDGSDY